MDWKKVKYNQHKLFILNNFANFFTFLFLTKIISLKKLPILQVKNRLIFLSEHLFLADQIPKELWT